MLDLVVLVHWSETPGRSPAAPRRWTRPKAHQGPDLSTSRSRPKHNSLNTLHTNTGGGGNSPKASTAPRPVVGVLALQGAYDVHAAMLRQLGAEARLVRRPAELDGLRGLVIPGGESTTFLWHLERDGFFDALDAFVRATPTFGTCAGCILLARDVTNPAQRSFGALDIAVERNSYGRQIDSSIVAAPTVLPGGPLEMVFIRAPRITRTGPDVQTLASRDGSPVLVQQRHLLAATFHPELSTDTRVHQHFLDLIRQHSSPESNTDPDAGA